MLLLADALAAFREILTPPFRAALLKVLGLTLLLQDDLRDATRGNAAKSGQCDVKAQHALLVRALSLTLLAQGTGVPHAQA